eukprot:SAG31_NODE_944_length_10844_cov_11.214053_2_plen_79_part_00
METSFVANVGPRMMMTTSNQGSDEGSPPMVATQYLLEQSPTIDRTSNNELRLWNEDRRCKGGGASRNVVRVEDEDLLP